MVFEEKAKIIIGFSYVLKNKFAGEVIGGTHYKFRFLFAKSYVLSVTLRMFLGIRNKSVTGVTP